MVASLLGGLCWVLDVKSGKQTDNLHICPRQTDRLLNKDNEVLVLSFSKNKSLDKEKCHGRLYIGALQKYTKDKCNLKGFVNLKKQGQTNFTNLNCLSGFLNLTLMQSNIFRETHSIRLLFS